MADTSEATFEMTVFPADPYRNRKLAYDPEVSPTIASIFNFFFQRCDEIIVVFICDSSDRKERVRKRKFDGWFESFNTEKYLKFDVELADSKSNIYYISVITINQNPYQQIIIQKFELLADAFRQDK